MVSKYLYMDMNITKLLLGWNDYVDVEYSSEIIDSIY